MTRESAPKGAPRIATAKCDQHQGSSAPPLGEYAGPLPLVDLQVYAARFAGLAGGVDGMADAEVRDLLAHALGRIASSLDFIMRGAA